MKTLAFFVLATFMPCPVANGTTPNPLQSGTCQPTWVPTFGFEEPGMNHSVQAMTTFDDGGGGGPALYAGGYFTSAGGVTANRVARWDGSSWSALGTGITPNSPSEPYVSALSVFDDGSGGGPALYAGGWFKIAGGVPTNFIAKWDGVQWSPLGSGVDNLVQALTVFDDRTGGGPALYAAGRFTSAGGAAASHIAKWDGSSWSAVGAGLGGSPPTNVHALTVFDDGGGPALYAGGDFSNAGGATALRVAKWDGASWSPVGGGVIGIVHALTVFDDGSGSGPALHAGGIIGVGPVSANVSRWDGASWSPLGTGRQGGTVTRVDALIGFDDGSGPALYASGQFMSAGGMPANNIAKWDGAGWSPLASGVGHASTLPAARSLAVFDDGSGTGPALHVGGDFTNAGQIEARRIAKWDGANWSRLGSAGNGVNSEVHALLGFDDGSGSGTALYAGGQFTRAGGIVADRIAKWNGSIWLPLGSPGFNNTVQALAAFDDGGGLALYAGGSFTGVGGTGVNRIAKWNGASWVSLGLGMNLNVLVMAVFDDGNGAGPALFAGGGFTNAGGAQALHVAKWDGTGWSPVGTGIASTVLDLAIYDDGGGGGPALYAGAASVSKWDGTVWSALPSVGMSVNALAVHDDGSGSGAELFAGGPQGVAKWNGMNWSQLGLGAYILELAVFDDGTGPALYAGGLNSNNVAKWDGSSFTWLASGTPTTGRVMSLGVFDDGNGPSLYSGGFFNSVGGVSASNIAQWGCSSQTPATFCTPKTTLVCGAASIAASGSSSATAQSGFVVRAAPVRGCRAGLMLYSNQPVQNGVAFGGPGDGLLCLSPAGLRRAGPIESGGTHPNFCDGELRMDVNQFHTLGWTASGCNPPPGQGNPAGFLGNMGTTVSAQMWGRDSIATGQVLSDGVSWSIGP